MTGAPPDGLSPLKRAIVEIRDLRSRLAAAELREREPIAVVGLGLRFPGGASDPGSFWQLLWDGVDAVTQVPADRWPVDALYDPDPDAPGKTSTRYGGFLDHIDQFDAAFFGIAPREAETIDPQQRLLLEVTWEALEHAGIPADRLFGSDAGVFVGVTNSDHFRLLLADRDQIDTYTTTGNAPSVAAGRLSYVLGTHGPAVAVDTACSSSLVAVHLAMQSLRARECDLALAGGVGLILTPDLTINFSRARMMAADGRSKAFDASADGYVRSEGCGQIVMKRLSDAQADGDRVLALLLGSAMNHDGRSGGLTAPNGPAQERVIAAALDHAGLSADAIGYVEAHGTGTPLGDPIEVHALGAALCRDRTDEDPLLLGSVKTNLGHLEGAAGIAGLIKVVLMLEHGAVPPHLHLHELNPHIAAEQLPIAVPTTPTPWPRRDGPRVAGVSSFGLSGTNAHVILAEPPAPAPIEPPGDEPLLSLLALSAKDPAALRALAGRYAEHLGSHPDQSLDDVAVGAALGRASLNHRLALVTDDRAIAIQRLEGYAAGHHEDVRTGMSMTTPDVAFLFTGHGSHHAGMGRALYSAHPVFRRVIDRCDELLNDRLDRSLPEVLFGEGDLLDQMRYAQPALFALQVALTELWRSWGVTPAVVAGHSAGEYAAAVVAGVLSLDDGLRLIAERGRLLQALPDDGEMVALFVEEERVAPAVALHRGAVGIAAVNGPTTTVISGRRDAVQAVIADLRLDDDEVRLLNVSVAAHSPLVEPILDEVEALVAGIDLRPPDIRLVSSMTGLPVSDELTDPGYWRRHLREPVRFGAVFDTLRELGISTFVEIGPHPTLLGLGQRSWPDASATWVPSLRRDHDPRQDMVDGLAALYTAGTAVDWPGFHGPRRRPRLALPTYPFQRQRHWSPAAGSISSTTAASAWGAATDAARRQSDQGPLDLDLGGHEERSLRMDELATAFTVAALGRLDLFTRAGDEHRTEALVARGAIVAEHAHLVERWLDHLADDGLLERVPGGAFRSVQPLPEPHLDELTASSAPAFAGLEPLFDYLCRCGGLLSNILSGDEIALTTLFPDGSLDTVDFLYRDWAVARYTNAIASAAVAALAAARPGHVLRVLEIGAGSGGTAAALVPALPADRTSYTFTDVSELFLVRATTQLADRPGVRCARLDIERPPAEQGLEHEGYDLVVATNVIDGTADVEQAVHHARSLLGPGGTLLLTVTVRHPRWLDLTTGLVAGWGRINDEERRREPILPADRWTELLDGAGFLDVEAWPGPDHPAAVLGQQVLLARRPGEVAMRSVTELDDRPLIVSTTPDALEALPALVATLGDALPSERTDLLVEIVRLAIGRVLRIDDPTRLPRDQPLLDLGFDSLMAVELRNILRQGLSLPKKLPATLLFDQPNIAAVATYLEAQVFATATPTAPTAAPLGRVPVTASAPRLGVEAIASLSDDEVEALLLQKLTEI